jgi:hypothetical protein
VQQMPLREAPPRDWPSAAAVLMGTINCAVGPPSGGTAGWEDKERSH